MAEKANLLAEIRQTIAPAVAQTLTSFIDWRIDRPGVVALDVRALGSGPTGPVAVSSRTLDNFGITSALLVLSRTVGAGGDTGSISRSQIGVAASGPQDAIAVTVANRALMTIVRDALVAAFPGLSASDFAPGEVPWLTRVVTITPTPTAADPTPTPYSLVRLGAGVDENQLIQIQGGIKQDGGWYVATADFSVTIAITVTATVVGGIPTLSVTPAILGSAVTNADASVAWWAYVLGMVVFLPLYFAAWGFDAFGGGRVASEIEKALTKVPAPGALGIPLPAGADLTARASLFQEDAERPLINIGPIQVPWPFRTHDLVITVGSMPLPSDLTVSCIKPDATDAARRIDAVGGVLDDGRPWGLPIDDAIASIQSGRLRLFVADPRAEVEVRQDPGGIPYLRSRPDQDPGNNLVNQPTCP